MKITTLTVGAFQENCYLVADEESGHAALVDPGAEAERIVAMVREAGVTLDAIWLTHAHIDHIGGIAGVKRVWDVPVYLHPEDESLYAAGRLQAKQYGLPFEQPAPTDHAFADGEKLTVGALAFEVLHTPGHAPGHVVLHGHGILIAGDLLFAGSIGRTDLPLSNPARMQESLERVATLPEETVVYSGHGPATTIGAERATNPFLTGAARLIRR